MKLEVNRTRSSSVGRGRELERKYRHWRFLFDNLRRVLDELYHLCYDEQSTDHCQEMLSALRDSVSEFESLQDWVQWNKNVETGGLKPSSISWELRKPKTVPKSSLLITPLTKGQSLKLSPTSKKTPVTKKSTITVSENGGSDTKTTTSVINIKPTSTTTTTETTATTVSTTPSTTTIATTTKTKPQVKPEKPSTVVANEQATGAPPMDNVVQTNSTEKVTTKSHAAVAANPVNKTPTLAKAEAPTTKPSSAPTKKAASVRSNNNTTAPTTTTPNANCSINNNLNSCNGKGTATSNTINAISNSTPNLVINRSNSWNGLAPLPIVVSGAIIQSKYVIDEEGFQTVRYKQRNKVARVKVIDSSRGDGYPRNNSTRQSPGQVNGRPQHQTQHRHSLQSQQYQPSQRALQLQEKFASPSRDHEETLRKHEEKQAKAQEAREKLLEQKAGKFKGIARKQVEIRAQKEEQQQQLKLKTELRQQRADEIRQEYMNKIVRKAHNEDSKVTEILFINSLEADTKKFDIENKEKVVELRLQDIQKERQQKLEEKASREAAFEKRRQAIEAENQARIEKLKEQRKLKEAKIEQQQQEKEKERQELAIQKENERKSKLEALNQHYAEQKEELAKKIITKQEESKRRHEENMESIRQKALELSVKQSSSDGNDNVLVCVPYEAVKMCSLCQVIIRSEVYLCGHLRGKRHNDAIRESNNGGKPLTAEELERANLQSIVNATPQALAELPDCYAERLKQARKKTKKLRQKLTTRVTTHEAQKTQAETGQDNAAKPTAATVPKEVHGKLVRLIKELTTLNANDKIQGAWPHDMVRTVERSMGELYKLCNQYPARAESFVTLGGRKVLTGLLSRILAGTAERPTSLTNPANVRLLGLYQLICGASRTNRQDFLHSGDVITMLDIFYHRINLCIGSESNTGFPYDSVVGGLCEFFSSIFVCIFDYQTANVQPNKSSAGKKSSSTLPIVQHIKDIVNYLVIMGVVDKLSVLLSSNRDSVKDLPEPQLVFVKQIIQMFGALTRLLTLFPGCRASEIVFGPKLAVNEDETQLMLTLRVNQLCGTVSMLYGFLLHSGAPVRDENEPPKVPQPIILDIALETMRFLNFVALLDLNLVQELLGGEGLSLQIRHICSYLIWYCSHHGEHQQLLHEVIILVGNFVVLNVDNQTLLQCGQRPTVLEQLCSLPFDYFVKQPLTRVLFPTLIACCYGNTDNMSILRREMSTKLLATFIDQSVISAQIFSIPGLLPPTEASMETNSSASQPIDSKMRTIITERQSLAIRFPKNRWLEAKKYFISE